MLDYEESAMSGKVVGLVAAAALLASVGVANAADHATANAKGPVKLTDNQFDKVTAGAATNQVAFLTAISAVDVTRLLAISIFTLGFLNGVPQAPARAHALPIGGREGQGKARLRRRWPSIGG
jgi:hypothetical protein